MNADPRQRLAEAVRKRDELLAWAGALPGRGARPADAILLIVLGGLGDTLLCEMLAWHLKQERPSRRVDVLAGYPGHVLAAAPTVDAVFLARVEKMADDAEGLRRCLSALNESRYGEAVAVLEMAPLTGLAAAFSGLALQATGAPVRIGRRSAGAVVLETPDGRIHQAHPPVPCITHEFQPGDPHRRDRHESLHARQCLGRVYAAVPDRPRLLPASGLAAWWAQELAGRFRGGGRNLLVGVNFESTYPVKAWPEERFLQVVREARRFGLRFLVLGQKPGPATEEWKRSLGEDVLDLRGKTDLPRLLAITEQCDLFLSVDSGCAHLAQAFQVPTVVLFGPSNEREFGPRDSTRHRLVLAPRPCPDRPCVLGPCTSETGCMTAISAEHVRDVLLDLAQAVREGRLPPRETVAGRPASVRSWP